MSLSETSLAKLQGVHADLVKVVERAAAQDGVVFVVTEGVRSVKRQRDLFAHGATTTMKSRHLTGHAVDLAVLIGDEISWSWPLYAQLAQVMKAAASEVAVPIEWGGDWRTFNDGPHFNCRGANIPAEFEFKRGKRCG